jgi:hypothetical protein
MKDSVVRELTTLGPFHDQGYQFQSELVEPQPSTTSCMGQVPLHVHHEIHAHQTHDRLLMNLVEHQWAVAGK